MEDRLKKLEQFADDARVQFAAIQARMGGLEDRMGGIESRMDRIEARMERLEAAILSSQRWIIGMMLAMFMAAITIMTFVLNNAVPKASSAPQPIVIYATAPAPVQGRAGPGSIPTPP